MVILRIPLNMTSKCPFVQLCFGHVELGVTLISLVPNSNMSKFDTQ